MSGEALRPIDEVIGQLRQLRLPHMRRAAPELLRNARAQRWEPVEVTRALLAEEIAGRAASSIRHRRKAAALPSGKTFDSWDESISSIAAPTQRALQTLEWLERGENLVIYGASGTGKSHFLEALAHRAIDNGYKASWFSVEALGQLLRRHRADNSVARAVRKILWVDLIVIDDIGLLPINQETAEGLYRVIDAAYERRSIALSSNLHPGSFDELIPKSLANATVDRLLHHAHVVETSGESIRLTQALAGKGVMPLKG